MAGAESELSLDNRRHFLQALRRMARPIIRLLLRHGIRYHEFADVARGAFVESAIRDGIKGNPVATRDQIALVTGIPRQRVDHYIDDENAMPTAEPTQRQLVTEVLHRWNTDPRYLGTDHLPLELEYDAPQGPSFTSLVAQVDPHANCASVADELTRSKCISHSDEGRLRATSHTFIWPGEWPHSIEYFGVALAQLIETLEYNRNPDNVGRTRLERFVSADHGVPARLLSAFHDFAKLRANSFLLDLDEWLARNSDTATRQQGARMDCGANVFFYLDSPADSRPPSTLVQSRRREANPGEPPK